ncbi:hypothetical protein D3C87_2158380 [compost metagenome]
MLAFDLPGRVLVRVADVQDHELLAFVQAGLQLGGGQFVQVLSHLMLSFIGESGCGNPSCLRCSYTIPP